MKSGMDVDVSGFINAIKNIKPGADDLLNMEGAGAAVVSSVQKIKVPVDTAATKNSIKSHYITSTRTEIVDDIGPETEYAPNIEYGRKDMPNYPIQPFVVPSATGNNKRDCINAITTTFHTWILSKWPK